MYSVSVRDHVMIAHSFKGELFGPAQRMHGATYVIDVEIRRTQLDENGVVADIGRAMSALKAVLEPLSYRNLDELDQFRGVNTTTEYLARYIFDGMAQRISAGELAVAASDLASMKVALHESHAAFAAFEGPLGG